MRAYGGGWQVCAGAAASVWAVLGGAFLSSHLGCIVIAFVKSPTGRVEEFDRASGQDMQDRNAEPGLAGSAGSAGSFAASQRILSLQILAFVGIVAAFHLLVFHFRCDNVGERDLLPFVWPA